MKISAKNPISNLNTNKMKQESFKGLWGKTTVTSDIDSGLGVNVVTETYYYYPFQDETVEQVKEIVRQNTSDYVDEKSRPNRYLIHECKVGMILPFQSVHFKNYQQARDVNNVYTNLKKVHFSVKDKYLNNTGEQISAYNENIGNILNKKA